MVSSKANIIKDLQADILRLQGFKSSHNASLDLGLNTMNDCFPNNSFPIGAVHEFLPAQAKETSSVSGFIAGLLSSLMGENGTALWISATRTLFPPALKSFGLEPDHIIFIDLQKEKNVLWVMEEALKCSALSAVVGEVRNIDFTASRRLQLAVEHSHVTGFIIRDNPQHLNTTACVSRWSITSLPSTPIDELPGVGYPKWKVELLRMRNGKPGSWEVQWVDQEFRYLQNTLSLRKSLSDESEGKHVRTLHWDKKNVG